MNPPIDPYAQAATDGWIARSLTDPAFASVLGRRRQATTTSPAFLDADRKRLLMFAGLITKVRYNSDIFEHLPWTLMLLRRHRLELAVFRDYYLTGASRKKDPREKVSRVLAYFERFSRSGKGRHAAGLRDVLAHERAEWELKQDLEKRAMRGAGDADVCPSGPLRVIRISRDPWKVMQGDLTGFAPRYRLYWVTAAHTEIQSVTISRSAACAAIAASVPRRLPELLDILRSKGMGTRAALKHLQALSSIGVLSVRSNAA